MKMMFPILDQKNRKMISGLLIDTREDIAVDMVEDMITTAISLDAKAS